MNWKGCGLVFTTPTGGSLDPANLTRRFHDLRNRADLRRIRFHDLRHSTAVLLLEQGLDLAVIKELLGHAHIGVTVGIYARVRLRLQRGASMPWATPSTARKAILTAHPPRSPSNEIAVKPLGALPKIGRAPSRLITPGEILLGSGIPRRCSRCF